MSVLWAQCLLQFKKGDAESFYKSYQEYGQWLEQAESGHPEEFVKEDARSAALEALHGLLSNSPSELKRAAASYARTLETALHYGQGRPLVEEIMADFDGCLRSTNPSLASSFWKDFTTSAAKHDLEEKFEAQGIHFPSHPFQSS